MNIETTMKRNEKRKDDVVRPKRIEFCGGGGPPGEGGNAYLQYL